MPIDQEFKNEYNKIKNTGPLQIRLNAKEKALLESMMRKEKWGNKSLYVKTKLFGRDVDAKARQLIEKGDEIDLQNLILRELEELNRHLNYIGLVYNKTIDLLNNDNADAYKFVNLTREVNKKVLRRSEYLMYAIYKVAKRLGVDTTGDDGYDVHDEREFSVGPDEINANIDPVEDSMDPF